MKALVERARDAQCGWATTPIEERLATVARVRELLAERAMECAEASASLRGRPIAEVLTAEVLPLLEAHRFAERNAAGLLIARKLGKRGRPLWLSRVTTTITREPRGIVLIVAPRNYPLMLPGIQLLQALVAGNAVLLKPAEGCMCVAEKLASAWNESLLPRHLLTVLPEDVENVHQAIAGGVDYAVLTGSAATGAAVYRRCAEQMIPATMELSGCDSVIIRDDADVMMASEALAFGLRLNGGETCIAPRRVFVARRIGERIEAGLAQLLESQPSHWASTRLAARLAKFLDDAAVRGGSVISGGRVGDAIRLPLVISGKSEVAELMEEEIFGSLLVMTFVDSDEEALTLARKSTYGLGVTVFSRDVGAARHLASQLNAGVVVINDMIVPTADPRIPFGGTARSGFGVTRGAEGLLSMTVPRVVTQTSGKHRRHFQPPAPHETGLFAGYIKLVHGRGRTRWSALKQLWRAIRDLGSGATTNQRPF